MVLSSTLHRAEVRAAQLARAKFYVAGRQRLARDHDDGGLSGPRRQFELVSGAQAQVDWGDEGQVQLEFWPDEPFDSAPAAAVTSATPTATASCRERSRSLYYYLW
jgi:hypothetical protein